MLKKLWNRLMDIRNKESHGSKAVEEAIEGFEEIIDNLNSALEEADEEKIQAQIAVGLAVNDRDRIEDVVRKGDNFLKGLKTLLQG